MKNLSLLAMGVVTLALSAASSTAIAGTIAGDVINNADASNVLKLGDTAQLGQSDVFNPLTDTYNYDFMLDLNSVGGTDVAVISLTDGGGHPAVGFHVYQLGNNWTGSGTLKLDVSFNNFGTTPAGGAFGSFSATSGFYRLQFTQGDFSPAFISDPTSSVGGEITVSGAPEPAAWSLMILGVGGMGAALRTRRRKVVAA